MRIDNVANCDVIGTDANGNVTCKTWGVTPEGEILLESSDNLLLESGDNIDIG